MKILLDTHILIWLSDGKVPHRAAEYVNNPGNTLLFSSASIWEVAIKYGRNDFNLHPEVLYDGLIRAGYQELSVTGRHTLSLPTLPPLHKDPFDRIILAQAASECVPLLTSDKLLLQYPYNIINAGGL